MESKRPQKPSENKELKQITLDQNLTPAEKKNLGISLSSTCIAHGEWFACGDGLIAQSATYAKSSMFSSFFRTSQPVVSIIRLYDLEKGEFLTPFIPKPYKPKESKSTDLRYEELAEQPPESMNLFRYDPPFDEKKDEVFKDGKDDYYISKNQKGDILVIQNNNQSWFNGMPDQLFRMRAKDKKFDSGTILNFGFEQDMQPITCFLDNNHLCTYRNYSFLSDSEEKPRKRKRNHSQIVLINMNAPSKDEVYFIHQINFTTGITPSHNGKFFYLYDEEKKSYVANELVKKDNRFSSSEIGEIPKDLFTDLMRPPVLSPTGLIFMVENQKLLHIYNPKTTLHYIIEVPISREDTLAFPDDESFVVIKENQLQKFSLPKQPELEIKQQISSGSGMNASMTDIIFSYAFGELKTDKPKIEQQETKETKTEINYQSEMNKLQSFALEFVTRMNIIIGKGSTLYSEEDVMEKLIAKMKTLSEKASGDDLALMRGRVLNELNIFKEKLAKNPEALEKFLSFLEIKQIEPSEKIKWSQIQNKVNSYHKNITDAHP